MKFTKPINREVDIDGNTFIVSFDDNGIDFRVKGKRKSAHVNWNSVLEMAEGEDGTSASKLFGISATAQSQHDEPQHAELQLPELQEPVFERQMPRQSVFDEPIAHHSQETSAAEPLASEQTQPLASEDSSDTNQETSRAVTAGETGTES